MLLLDHDEDGALGVVLNRPSVVPVGEVLPGWAEVVAEPDVLFQGGPVGTDSALAVGASAARPEPSRSGFRRLYGDVGIVDLDTPTEVAARRCRGCGSSPGTPAGAAEQLRREIEEGSWYVVPVEPGDLFGADPRGAVAAGAAPPARASSPGSRPAPSTRPELSRDSPCPAVRLGSTVSTQMSPGVETIEDRRTQPDRER